MNATIDKFGRMVIPKRLRERLGLHPGSVLRLQERGRQILLEAEGEEPRLTLKDGILVVSGKATGDLAAAVRSGRDARMRELLDRGNG